MRAPSRPRSPNSRPAAATMAAIVFCGDRLAGTFSLLITLAPLECRSPSPACRWARKLVHRKIYGPVLRPVRQSGATMPRSTPHHSHRICGDRDRSEEHTSELQSLMRRSYAVLLLKNNKGKKIGEEKD